MKKLLYIAIGLLVAGAVAQAQTIMPVPFLSRISSGDTTPNYLFNKLVAGSGITLTKNNPGANETITIDSTVSTSTLVSYAYASGTFMTYPYGSSTFMQFVYGSSTFPTFSYASNTFMGNTYASSTFVNFSYATNTFATISSLASYVTFIYATATFPSFTYATNTYYFASNPSGYITNSVSNLTNYPTYTYASSSYVKVIDTQSIAGAKTFSGTTTLATTTATSLSASGMVGVATTTPTNQLTVASGTVAVLEYDWGTSTSTSMTVDWRKANTQKMNISTSAVTITFVNGTNTPGAQLMLFICNPPSGTAGAITWTHVYWPSATAPTQTTTANNCDLWSFKATYSTSSNIIIGAQSAKF